MEKRDVTSARLTENKIFLQTRISPLFTALNLGYTIEETIIFKDSQEAFIYWHELIETMDSNYIPKYDLPNPKLKNNDRFDESIDWSKITDNSDKIYNLASFGVPYNKKDLID